MAGVFNGTTQYLENTGTMPVTAVPITVGLWVYPIASGVNSCFWSLAHGTTATNSFFIKQRNVNDFAVGATAGTDRVANGGTMTANKWYFIVGRFITTTNRRMDLLQWDGPITQDQNTASVIPSVNRMAIGVRDQATRIEFFSGLIGEYWITNTDIQPGGAAMAVSTLHQLARLGPFSLPHIAKDIIEYRSLRSGLISGDDKPDEVYWGKQRQADWINTAGVILGDHPPLYPGYVKPGQIIRPLVI